MLKNRQQLTFVIFLLSIFVRVAIAGERENMETVFEKLPKAIVQETDVISMPKKSGILPWILSQEWLKYTPKGDHLVSDNCSWKFEEKKASLGEFANDLHNYIVRCEPEIETNRNLLSSTYDAVGVRYLPHENPYARHVMFQMPGGVTLKGYLAMHDDRPRPLVVVRLGIFSNTENFFPERHVFIQLFEQGPFNVLLLESMTGVEFAERNDVRGFGGMDEGVQNAWVIQQLTDRKNEFSKLISEVDLLGESLGGHSIWFTNIFERKNPEVKAAMTLCPLINLRDTLDFHLVQGITGGGYIESGAKLYLHKSLEQHPELGGDHFLEKYLKMIAAKYTGPDSDNPSINWPPELAKTKKNFFAGNQFFDAYHDIKIPMLVFATMTDPLVPYTFNIGRFTRGDYAFPRSEVAVETLRDGIHCGFPSFLDWHETASIFQSYYFNFSNERFTQRSLVAPVSDASWEKIRASGLHPRFDVTFSDDSTEAVLTIQWLKEHPSWTESFFAPKDLVKVHLPDFDFSRHVPVENETERNLYARWIRQNIEVSEVSDRQAVELKWRVAE